MRLGFPLPVKKRPSQQGPANHNWKGGRRIHKQSGRPTICVDGRHVLEHRIIASQMLGRALLSTEVVHHENGDILDNRPENLLVVKRGQHTSHHNYRRPKMLHPRNAEGRFVTGKLRVAISV